MIIPTPSISNPLPRGGYTVTVPALPAVITEGDTYEDAVAMAQDAIACYLEALAKEVRAIPIEKERGRPLSARVRVAVPAT